MSHPIPTEDYMDYATENQLAFVWEHFRDFGNHGKNCDLSTEDAKKAMLEHFGVEFISDITKEQASDYINEVPRHERSSVGYCTIKQFEKDWI